MKSYSRIYWWRYLGNLAVIQIQVRNSCFWSKMTNFSIDMTKVQLLKSSNWSLKVGDCNENDPTSISSFQLQLFQVTDLTKLFLHARLDYNDLILVTWFVLVRWLAMNVDWLNLKSCSKLKKWKLWVSNCQNTDFSF